MAHLIQVGAGSGGMPVLDLLCRDPRIDVVTLIEPDVYKPHNVERHLFPLGAVGRSKADVAAEWLTERRPDLEVRVLKSNLLDPLAQPDIEQAGAAGRRRHLRRGQRARQISLGPAHAPARQAVDARRSPQRRHRRLRSLVCPRRPLLRLRRQPSAAFRHGRRGEAAGLLPARRTRAEATIPASKASIQAIASLHALVTLALLDDPPGYQPGFHQPAVDAATRTGRVRRGVSTLPVSASPAPKPA